MFQGGTKIKLGGGGGGGGGDDLTPSPGCNILGLDIVVI